VEALVEELKKIMVLKSTTVTGDIIIMAVEEPQSLIYGLVTDIERDEHKKDEWWHVSLTLLSLPLQKTTITLRTPQLPDRRFLPWVVKNGLLPLLISADRLCREHHLCRRRGKRINRVCVGLNKEFPCLVIL
jgi:hypothetical protein